MDVAGMVLCAGLGTRLRPLTDLLPKPAVPLCGLPLVRYGLATLARAGVRRAAVNVHHLADDMERSARQAGAALGVEIAISREPVLAGTGGALREARELLRGASEVVVLNGDVLFDADLPAALAAHRAARGEHGALATMVLAPMPPGARYASVEADHHLAVRRIAGSFGPGPGPGVTLTPWHFTGVHVLSGELLDAIGAEPFACDVNRHVYPALMDGRLRGHVDRGHWSDLGAPRGYLRAHADLLGGRLAPGRLLGADPWDGLSPLGRGGVWAGPGVHVGAGVSFVAPVLLLAGARVEAGARVGPFAVIGRSALVGAGAHVEEAVVWDGSEVQAGERLVRAVAAGALRVA